MSIASSGRRYKPIFGVYYSWDHMNKDVRSKGRWGALAAATVLVVGAAGCSSSGPSGNSGLADASQGGTRTFTVGVLTDLTGPAASGDKTSVDGVKAGTFYAARNGYKIKYVVADTATNPATTKAAAQKLVTQDHVGAVIAISAVTQLAASYFTARGIPVIGTGSDGPEWLTAKNMFCVFGALNTTKVSTTFGLLMKKLGVTSVGTLGYGVSPVSSEKAKGNAASAKAAGLKVGYVNANFPFGSTNVNPVAIAMKNDGVDGVTAATDPNTGFALITALRQQGVNLKAALLGTGYGSDLLQAGPGALAAAQNVYFAMQAEPFAMSSAGTKQFAADLKSAGITTTQATYGQYGGYLSMGLLVQALKGAGSSPTSASLIKSLGSIHDWNGVGLLGDMKVDINDRKSFASGPNNCAWVTKLEGETFTAVAGADPICGKVVPGLTVSSSS
jgi:branched-chain amino acid transport system substrate-binding protein